MLLMSFQPIYSQAEVESGKHLRSIGKHAAAGYRNPVWCCGGSLADMFASAYFAAPRFPDSVIFFETDDYVRVDKAGWYAYVRDDKELDEALLNPELPADMCEFITDASVMIATRKVVIPLVNLEHSIRNVNVKLPIMVHDQSLLLLSDDVFMALYELLSRWYDEMEYVNFGHGLEGDIAYKNTVHKARVGFLHTMFPVIYTWLSGESVTPDIAYMTWSCRRFLLSLYRQVFIPWMTGSCSVNSLQAIFNQAESSVVIDPVALPAIVANAGEFNRSLMLSKCPCNSGKRFDKCHGKRYRVLA